MTWNQLRTISRWFKTFNIQLASERKTRCVAKEWVGQGLRVEMAPLPSDRGDVQMVPWAYMYNLVAVVLKRLDVLNQVCNQV